ncbi:hypothetical protein BJ912DRAFT_219418 [Pholiota molesta]|nr:hypothetical protein BJ912DRAFT_219418 [Pholiota molesta]
MSRLSDAVYCAVCGRNLSMHVWTQFGQNTIASGLRPRTRLSRKFVCLSFRPSAPPSPHTRRVVPRFRRALYLSVYFKLRTDSSRTRINRSATTKSPPTAFNMEVAASSTTSAQARRTNPSRSRRGGPGVGTSDVDMMILESYKRKLETEPLIPADTPFFLTTNSAKVSGDSTSNGDSAISINIVANDRYFDRPEVLKAFREQEIIQTPEFWPISESSSVGGRFRPRGAEDEREETSDTAYEKRHKKFETFEKRQRLREKDKLKHEHYKLKERIEQLRAMDSSAFMALPFSFGVGPVEEQVVAEVDQTTEESQIQANGIIPPTEGERRKKAMLEHAIGLERRYSYLLPPDRVRKTQEIHVEDEDSENERILQAGSSKNESIRFRLPARSSLSTTPASSPAATKPPRKYTKGQGKQARQLQNNIPLDQVSSVSSPNIDVEMRTPEPRQVSPPPPPSGLPGPPIEVPEMPPALVAPLPKPPTSALQTNGRNLAQKDTYVFQNIVDTEAAAVQPPEKFLRARHLGCAHSSTNCGRRRVRKSALRRRSR